MTSSGMLLILMTLVSGANSKDRMDPPSFVSGFLISDLSSSASKYNDHFHVIYSYGESIGIVGEILKLAASCEVFGCV